MYDKPLKNQYKQTRLELLKRSLRKNWILYLFLALPIAYFVIFKYIPMTGIVLAFRKYVPGKSAFGTEWRGLLYINSFLRDSSFWNTTLNTLRISIVSLVFTFTFPIVFALLLNELPNGRFRKIVQTTANIPKFLSTVVVVMLINATFSPSYGIVNNIIKSLGGDSVFFINNAYWFLFVYIVSELWQFVGWNSIIYMAVLSSASAEQYEAAMVDGANRWKQTIHITLPVLAPTICLNLVIAIGYALNIGYEKILLLYNMNSIPTFAEVLQTLIYRRSFGLGGGATQYSVVTAMGLFQGVISLTLLWFANKAVNKIGGYGLW